MRVLFVTPMFPSSKNIQQGRFVLDLAEALEELSLDVRVVSIEQRLIWPFCTFARYRRNVARGELPHYPAILRLETTLLPRNIGVITMAGRWGRRTIQSMRESWAGWHPDLVHSHTLFPGALIGEKVAAQWGVPHVVTSHGADTRVHIHRPGPRRAICKLLTKNLTVVGVGLGIVEKLSQLTLTRGPVRCIYNGVNTRALQQALAVSQIGADCRRHVILAVGNLVPTKGIDLLLHAFRHLQHDYPVWDVIVVGGGTEHRHLSSLAEKLGLGNRVEFTGPLPTTEVMKWMAACDIFCLPSWSEGFGIVYLEAMALGKPVIAVEGQGIAPIVQRFDNGLLVRPKDIESTEQALRALMNDAGLRARMGSAGRQAVEANFTWSHCAASYFSLYKELLSRR